jgi:hypothetical protein
MTHPSMILTNNFYAEDYNLWIKKNADLLERAIALFLKISGSISYFTELMIY